MKRSGSPGSNDAAAWRGRVVRSASAWLFALSSAAWLYVARADAEPIAGEELRILPPPGSSAPPSAGSESRALPAPVPPAPDPAAVPSGAASPRLPVPGAAMPQATELPQRPAAPAAGRSTDAASSPAEGQGPPAAPAAASPSASSPTGDESGDSAGPRATFLREALSAYFLPDSIRFGEATAALESAIGRLCEVRDEATLGDARAAWVRALAAWDALDAVEIGPILDRRSMFQIDFWPTRPFAIDIVVRNFPESARTLDVVSAPAKGLPALEYLLWPQGPSVPVLSGTNQCAYARVLASGLRSEARALDAGYRELASLALDGAQSKALLTQLVNQTFGAIEGLRGKSMLRPASIRDAKLYPRPYSGETVHTWSARWSAIRRLLLGADGEAPSLERHLRDAGQADAAERLHAAVLSGDAAMREVLVADSETAVRAAKGLAATETALDRDVAPALRVTIGFRGADGD